jgi:serine protease Do
MNLTFSRCARASIAAFVSGFAIAGLCQLSPGVLRQIHREAFIRREDMRTRNLRALAAALPLGVLLVTALPVSVAAQANRGFDIMTLVGPGSTIGVEISELDTASVERGDNGVVIKSVRQGTPASRAGLQAGDIVLEFDGERVRSVRQFRRLVEETPPGRQVEALVLRDKSRRTVTVTPEGSSTRVQPAEPFSFERRLPGLVPGLVPGIPVQGRLGATVMSLEPQLASYFGTDGGALITSVTDGSPAATAGLKAGDVIVRVGNRSVDAPADVADAIRAAAPGKPLEIEVRRDRKDVRIMVTIPAPAPARNPAGRTQEQRL